MGWKLASHAKVPAGNAIFGSAHVPAVQWYDTSTAVGERQAALASGVIPSTALAAVKVNNASFAITINGSTVQCGPLDLTLASDLTSIAATIDANLANATVDYTAPRMTILTSSATTAAISYASAPAAGTDISGLLCLTAATGATIGP